MRHPEGGSTSAGSAFGGAGEAASPWCHRGWGRGRVSPAKGATADGAPSLARIDDTKAPIEGSRMLSETLTIDKIFRRVRDTVEGVIDLGFLSQPPLRPTQGCISLGLGSSFKPSPPPVPEDSEQREANRQSVERRKRAKDVEKKKKQEKSDARARLEKRHKEQRREVLPLEPSPPSSNPDDDGGDSDSDTARRAGQMVHLGGRPEGSSSQFVASAAMERVPEPTTEVRMLVGTQPVSWAEGMTGSAINQARRTTSGTGNLGASVTGKRLLIPRSSQKRRAGTPPLAPHKALKRGAGGSAGEVER